MEQFGIYIHIPFCKKKCSYCDFVSFENKDQKQKDYIDALIIEIKQRASQFLNKKVTSIYIGGGTPSFIESEYIVKIINVLKEEYDVKEDAEITIEINPGIINEEKLLDYKKVGINRISIGLQSTNNRILKLIGRIHTYEQFLESYEMIKNAGFNNINVDLMLAIPTQTETELLDSVCKVINLNPSHISLYSLILEENTKLEKMIDSNELKLVDEEIERKMYWKTKKMLQKNGYNHYEISNFSKKGLESKHNMNCWNQEEYIGFGLAAHSYYENKRFSNKDSLDEYIKNIKENKIEKNIILHEEQNREEKAKEYMLLGFRKIDGISISEFERKFRINPLFYFRFEIERLVNKELIEVDLDKIKLTKKGLDLANQVFEEFV